MADTARTYRFGVFLFHSALLELSRDGRPVRLQPQPAQLLAALLANAGRLVTREELRRVIWPDDTFVDFDRGLNFCVAQVRTALGDDAAVPRYIRTLPKKGYEFICPVEVFSTDAAVASDSIADRSRSNGVKPPGRGITARTAAIALIALAASIAAALATYSAIRAPASLPIVAVTRFDNETGDDALTRFGDVLTDTVVERLTNASGGKYSVVGNAAILRRPRAQRDLRAIATSLGAAYVVLGQIQRDNQQLRVLAHLIRLPDQTHIRVSRTDALGEETLAVADDVAGRIAEAFGPLLREPGVNRSSHALATR